MKIVKNRSDSKAKEIIESLFTGRYLSKPKTHCFQGNIDSLVNRRLLGWVVRNDSVNEPIEIEVYSENVKVGEGIADKYRSDLEKKGFGDGKHGFMIDLSSKLFSTALDNITLREKKSGVQVSTNTFHQQTGSDCVAEVVGIVGRVLTAHLYVTDNSELPPQSVEILVDGASRLPCAISDNSGGRTTCECLIPAELNDGIPHTFEVIANDKNVSSTAYLTVLSPVTTPEELLADSLGKKGYIGLTNSSEFRYESLNEQLSRFMVEGMVGGADLSGVYNAHKEVLRGFHDRKTYSRLKLPDVVDPDLSIIIPARDNFPITYHCIASLILAYNKASYEIILIDDQSSDETTTAEEIIGNLRVVRNETNLGFVKSNNKAVEQANGRYICLLNNDTEVTSGWIDEALSVFDLINDVGAVGCKLLYPDGSLQEAGGIVWKNGTPWNYGKNENASRPGYNYTREADYLSAAALFIKRDVWDEVGGFSVEYAPAYYEDTDLAFKIRDAGYRTLYCPKSVVIHFEGKSNGTSTKTGVKHYQEINSTTFKQKWFSKYKSFGVEGTAPHLEVDRGKDFRVLVLDAVTPCRNSDAGSYAAIQEMKLMMELGCKLTFVPENLVHMGVHTDYLEKIGVECIYYPFFPSMDQLLSLRGSEFDAVYVTRYGVAANNMEFIKKHTTARIIFNNADLHFLRELRQKLQTPGKDFSGPLATRERELSVIDQADVAVCYTDAERAVIVSHLMKEDNILKCPWVVVPKKDIAPFSERDGIAFLGGYAHQPNVEGVKYFCSRVMPFLLDKNPELVLRIYGSKVPKEFSELESNNVEVIGFVEDVSEVYQKSKVFISPLLSGAGLKGKVIECMSFGLPAVMTSVSAEGTGLVHSQTAYIADSVSEWCEYIQLLYTDEEAWSRLSKNSQQLAESIYSPREGLKAMRKIMSKVDIYADKKGQELFKGYLR